MRAFTVPFNIDTEDKIIGGYVSLRQFFWLFMSFLIVLFLFVLNTNYVIRTSIGNGAYETHINYLSLIIRIILSITSVIIGLLMAFLKISELSFDKYLFKFIKFKFRKHILKDE